MAESMPFATALAFDLDGTFDSSSERYEVLPGMSLGATTPLVQSEGMNGSRSRRGEKVVQGQIKVDGDVPFEPTPDDLDLLLPRILGAAESSDVFAVADTLPEFYALVDRVAKVHKYSGCQVGKAVFDFSPGALMKLTLSIVGKAESELNAGSFVAGALSTLQAYILHQLVVNLHGSARQVDRWVMTIDNVPDVEFYNSQTAFSITPADRIVTVATTVPYNTSHADLYTLQKGGTYANGSATATNGNRSFAATLNSLRALDLRSSTIAQRNEALGLPLTFQAFQTSTTKEIVVNNDSTP